MCIGLGGGDESCGKEVNRSLKYRVTSDRALTSGSLGGGGEGVWLISLLILSLSS